MAKKKTTQISVSQEDNEQAQRVLEHYHQIAGTLHTGTERKQAETALDEINNMSESAQMALLKMLSKEHHTDAADVLVAIHELSPVKSVRKEARRSLIRLEEVRIYPQWQPPIDQPLVLAVQLSDTSRRFWKGMVTDSRDAGEVQLLLCWEQGDDYRDVRVLAFLLDFWHDGVKDFFTRVESKRSFEKFVAQTSQMSGTKMKDCSLAEGRRMILDALATNKQYGTVPHKDYRSNLSLVNQLVLEAPGLDAADTDLDKESEDIPDLRNLSPQAVVTTFVESWIDGDYDTAYDLLSSDSSIREGLSREEWIERREAWANEANPGELKPDFIREREPQRSLLWLPNPFSAGRSTTRKEIEAGWSIELDETALSDTLPELPEASVIYEETERHWFWTSYTLVQEQDSWRIQRMTDEVTNAQSLSIEELQKRIHEEEKYLEEFAQKHKLPEIRQLTDADAQRYLQEILWRLMHAIYYTDALIKKLPLDSSIYEQAAGRTLAIGQLERCIVYLEQLTQRFAEQRGEHLRQLAAVQTRLSNKYFEEGDDERGRRCQELAEEALSESLSIEESVGAHVSLAELLIEMDRLNAAEDHLLRAKALTNDSSEEAHIEMHLGEIAMERVQYDEALIHYQRVAELAPNYVDTWVDLAEAYKMLENFEEAEANYRRAIELQPDDADLYYTLSKMYSESNQLEKAFEVMEDALSVNPDSAILNAYLAIMYLESGDYRQAEIFLDKAERLDPDLEVVPMFRQVLKLSKLQPTRNIPQLNRPKKKRR